MATIFKSSLQNLSLLPTSLKVEPLAKPKTGLKFFENTTKPKTKVSTLSLNPKTFCEYRSWSVKEYLSWGEQVFVYLMSVTYL